MISSIRALWLPIDDYGQLYNTDRQKLPNGSRPNGSPLSPRVRRRGRSSGGRTQVSYRALSVQVGCCLPKEVRNPNVPAGIGSHQARDAAARPVRVVGKLAVASSR